MNIKIDVDNVIRDLNQALCDFYSERFPKAKKITPSDFKVYDINETFPPIDNTDASEFFFLEHGKEVFFDLAKPIDGVKEALEKLECFGHKITICTWQMSSDNMRYTLDFFDKWKLRFHDICFTRDKYLIDGQYLIDDNPEFLDNVFDGSRKIIIDQPYNRWYDNNFTFRVNSLKDAVDYIIEQGDSFADPFPF